MSRKSKLIKTHMLAGGGIIFAPASFLNASIEELLEVCNGCGAANAKFDFIPDRIYGTYIGHACNIHDWMYHKGHTIEDKKEADRTFLNNMYRLVERDKHKWYKPTRLQRIRVREYYIGVQHFGGSAFWHGKN